MKITGRSYGAHYGARPGNAEKTLLSAPPKKYGARPWKLRGAPLKITGAPSLQNAGPFALSPYRLTFLLTDFLLNFPLTCPARCTHRPDRQGMEQATTVFPLLLLLRLTLLLLLLLLLLPMHNRYYPLRAIEILAKKLATMGQTS